MAAAVADRGGDRPPQPPRMVFFYDTTRTYGNEIGKWWEKMHESLQTGVRKEARSSGVAAATNRVRCGEAYGIM